MQEQHIEALISDIEDRVPSAKDAIRAEFNAVIEDGKLLSLSSDEVMMLRAFRMWRRTSDSVRGVFHFKMWDKKGKRVVY